MLRLCVPALRFMHKKALCSIFLRRVLLMDFMLFKFFNALSKDLSVVRLLSLSLFLWVLKMTSEARVKNWEV